MSVSDLCSVLVPLLRAAAEGERGGACGSGGGFEQAPGDTQGGAGAAGGQVWLLRAPAACGYSAAPPNGNICAKIHIIFLLQVEGFLPDGVGQSPADVPGGG